MTRMPSEHRASQKSGDRTAAAADGLQVERAASDEALLAVGSTALDVVDQFVKAARKRAKQTGRIQRLRIDAYQPHEDFDWPQIVFEVWVDGDADFADDQFRAFSLIAAKLETKFRLRPLSTVTSVHWLT